MSSLLLTLCPHYNNDNYHQFRVFFLFVVFWHLLHILKLIIFACISFKPTTVLPIFVTAEPKGNKGTLELVKCYN